MTTYNGPLVFGVTQRALCAHCGTPVQHLEADRDVALDSVILVAMCHGRADRMTIDMSGLTRLGRDALEIGLLFFLSADQSDYPRRAPPPPRSDEELRARFGGGTMTGRWSSGIGQAMGQAATATRGAADAADALAYALAAIAAKPPSAAPSAPKEPAEPQRRVIELSGPEPEVSGAKRRTKRNIQL